MVPRELPLRIFHPPRVALIAPQPCFLDHLPASTLFTAIPKKLPLGMEDVGRASRAGGRETEKSRALRASRSYESCDSVPAVDRIKNLREETSTPSLPFPPFSAAILPARLLFLRFPFRCSFVGTRTITRNFRHPSRRSRR